jgi:Peptidase A4 family
MRVRHRVRYMALVATVVIVGVAVLVAVQGVGSRAGLQLGSFAGYVWRGRVSSVRASWTVPRLLPGSPHGIAATWIGAEAPGVGHHRPFIQIGVNEGRLSIVNPGGTAYNGYYVFWSDTKQHFHPQYLFRVNAGDDLSASLTFVRNRWTLAIRDTNSRQSSHFTTSDEDGASFDQAEWIQEDVVDERTHKPYPYPRLGKIEFHRLEVNSSAPAYVDLYSTWMSLHSGSLAPTPLHKDSFVLHRATLNPIGVRYLDIVDPANAANSKFATQLFGWTAKTPYARIQSASAVSITAIHRNLRALSSERWPASVQGKVDSLIAEARVILALTRPPAILTAATLSAWRSALTRAGVHSSYVAHLLRRSLGLPEVQPSSSGIYARLQAVESDSRHICRRKVLPPC